LNVLKYFGKLAPKDKFFIYHKKDFNPELRPPNFSNYVIKKIYSPFLWTQTKFSWDIRKDKIDTVWMPMHNAPFFKSKKIKTVVTIHDLAFKKFPKTFPQKDLFKLNSLTGLAVSRADKIIAVSQSTKKDILKFYPNLSEDKIRVIYHGFDKELFQKKYEEGRVSSFLKKNNLESKKYLLYVGAIQPRKNLKILITAFELLKLKKGNENLKLVIAGGKAWNWKGTMKRIDKSSQKENIILTGKISFEELSVAYREALVFCFPSLYEGFGIPVLEAFASKIPVVAARNSSLEEVGGDAAAYFKESDPEELFRRVDSILRDDNLRREMIEGGLRRLEKFSWEKCAKETLDFLKA